MLLDPPSLWQRLTLLLALATLIASFGSSFQYGYNVAAVNSPSEFMKQFYNDTYSDRTGELIDTFALTLLWSVTVSMFPFGGFIGSLLVGPLVNNLGRKGTLLFNNIFSIVPAIFMGCSKIAKAFELIIISRFLVGICAGVSSNVVPMYLGELAPKNLRGALGVVPQLFITIGILVAQLLGLRNILANEEGWPILLALTAVPAVLQVLLLPFFPESPRYLLIQKKNEEAARNGKARLCAAPRKRVCGWPGFPTAAAPSRGAARPGRHLVAPPEPTSSLLQTPLQVFVVELWGRRRLLLLGFSTCFMACAVLTVALALQDTVSWMPYVSIACVIIYVIGHALGPSPIPALIITEIFLQSSRPAAFMIGGSVHWLSNFTVGLVFPFIQVGLGAYSFIIFAIICLLTTIYTFFIIPETKSKTFIEINQIFANLNKVSGIHPEKEELKTFPSDTSKQQ
uniref:Solute carrier family 2, facilitated glucose transporter member 5 n=1 Tax=Spermophilus dauricus TaxID=99837 RepID=A0A8C9QGK2_SPEDA